MSEQEMPKSYSLAYRIVAPIRNLCAVFFKFLPKFFVRWLMDWFRYSNGIIGFGIRYLCLKRLAKGCKEKVIVFPSVFIKQPESLEVGTNVSIHEFCYIDAFGGLKIGDHVAIGHSCTIMCCQHEFNIPGELTKSGSYIEGPVEIERDVWLGAHVKVMPGVKIGQGSVIGAGSVVTKDIPEYSVAMGVPAKVTRSRFEEKNS